jgi:hypothetical protein
VQQIREITTSIAGATGERLLPAELEPACV